MLRRALIVVVCALALTSCRLDVQVDVDIEPDGKGTVTVHAVADAELVAQVPDLAESLAFDDVVTAGWQVTGPTATADGGLEVTLVHAVSGPQELATVLNSLGPPFVDMRAGRTTVEDQTTNAVEGTLVLANGFQSFADSDLVAAVGGLPFGDEIAATNTTPAASMSVTFRAALPGELVSSNGDVVDGEAGTFEWIAPLDGTSLPVSLQTVQRPAPGGSWARPLATLALIAFAGWVVVAVAFIAFVIGARRRKAQRRASARPRP